ncbi:FAD-binding protein [Achromobacter sp. ACM02]|uniref:FAD-binding protein n=1 Tax=Achromobacter sp. ACM02 TaxID=2769305 RepID=UPI00178476CC|nr:FAD-binding protein [Achromobacter sp. ACM02]MBD9384655.1 FAD-binding protein [Achromobacter sp. ACM02]
MQPSRRAFLLGRRPARSPWSAFMERLSLLCQGSVRDSGEAGEGGPRGLLTPARDADVAHARTLCAEYHVTLALAGAEGPFETVHGPLLTVDPSATAGLVRLSGETGRWRAQPGTPLAMLAQAGLRQFAGLPGGLTLAAWLAAKAHWPAGRCADSGVVALDVMLADGIEETLGPFGESDVQPLRSATVQRLVPALFQLASGGDAFATRDGEHWLGRYRLDALKPEAPATVNLAHLLLGHGGTLAWVQSVTLADAGPAPHAPACPNEPPGLATTRLDSRVKALFDPDGRFLSFHIAE